MHLFQTCLMCHQSYFHSFHFTDTPSLNTLLSKFFCLDFPATSPTGTPQTTDFPYFPSGFPSPSMIWSLLSPLYHRLVFTLLFLLSFTHKWISLSIFWAKPCRCFSWQLHLPNQFPPTLLIVSTSCLLILHAKTSVSGVTCVTCWSRSVNS